MTAIRTGVLRCASCCPSIGQSAAAYVAGRMFDGEPIQLCVMSVQSRPRADARLNSIVSQQIIDEYILGEGNETIDQPRPVLDLANRRHETHMAFGEIARGIDRHATEQHFDQIVMGTRGTSALRGFVMGSVATRVIQLTSLPVTLVNESCRTYWSSAGDAGGAGLSLPEHETESPRRILIAVDGSGNSARAVEHVIHAVRDGVKRSVILLNVQTPFPTGGAWDKLSAEDLAKGYQEEGHLLLREARNRLDVAGIPCQHQVSTGAPAVVIAESCSEWACDQIVMGTRGMGASGNLFLGSVAVKVVHSVSVPVTLVQ